MNSTRRIWQSLLKSHFSGEAANSHRYGRRCRSQWRGRSIEQLEDRRLLATLAFQEPLLHMGTALGETGSNWQFKMADWNHDGILDLVGINQRNTNSGTTEVHILNGADQFGSFLLQTDTALHETGSTWTFDVGDWNSNGSIDVIAFHRDTSNTGEKSTAIHVLDGSTNYASFAAQTRTALGSSNAPWEYEVTHWDGDGVLDIVAINKSGSNSRTEVHVLGSADGYQSFLLQTVTALHATDSTWDFEMSQASKNLVAIHKSGTGTETTEIHSLNANDNYQSFVTQMGTGLRETGSNFVFDIADFNADGVSDLVAVKKSSTSTDSTEVHIFNGSGTTLRDGGSFVLESDVVLENGILLPAGTLAVSVPPGGASIASDIIAQKGSLKQDGTHIFFEEDFQIQNGATGQLVLFIPEGAVTLSEGTHES